MIEYENTEFGKERGMKGTMTIGMRVLQLCLSVLMLILIPATGYVAIIQGAANPVWLIMPEEAALPEHVHNEKLTNLSMPLPNTGPDIQLARPLMGTANASPLEIKIQFQPRKAPIDLSTLNVTLVKWINIDLTDRVKDYTTPEGIHILKAELPSGEYTVRVTLGDTDGGMTVKQVNIGPTYFAGDGFEDHPAVFYIRLVKVPHLDRLLRRRHDRCTNRHGDKSNGKKGGERGAKNEERRTIGDWRLAIGDWPGGYGRAARISKPDVLTRGGPRNHRQPIVRRPAHHG